MKNMITSAAVAAVLAAGCTSAPPKPQEPGKPAEDPSLEVMLRDPVRIRAWFREYRRYGFEFEDRHNLIFADRSVPAVMEALFEGWWEMLDNRHPECRENAIRFLANHVPQADRRKILVPRLLELLRDQSSGTMDHAAGQLELFVKDDPGLAAVVVEKLMVVCRDGTCDPELRRVAYRFLPRFDAAAVPHLAAIMDIVTDRNSVENMPDRRVTALDAAVGICLGNKIRDPAMLADIRTLTETAFGAEINVAAAEALEKLDPGNPAVVPVLVKCLEWRDSQALAVAILSQLGLRAAPAQEAAKLMAASFDDRSQRLGKVLVDSYRKALEEEKAGKNFLR